MPTFTKNVATIWWVNFATVILCYAYAFASKDGEALDDGSAKSVLPKPITRALNALDYGSGKERGVRK